MRRNFWPPEGRAVRRTARVGITFDGEVALLAGKESSTSWTRDGLPFVFLLNSILTEHPELEERYPPGRLAFTVNGESPEPLTPIRDGDEVRVFLPAGGARGVPACAQASPAGLDGRMAG